MNNQVIEQLSGRTNVMSLDYKVAALLCYAPIPLLCLIAPIVFLKTEPKSNKLVRFHAVQSLAIAVSSIAIGVANGVLMSLLVSVFGFGILAIATPASSLISLGFLGLMIYGMYCIWTEKEFKLPVLGDIAEKNS